MLVLETFPELVMGKSNGRYPLFWLAEYGATKEQIQVVYNLWNAFAIHDCLTIRPESKPDTFQFMLEQNPKLVPSDDELRHFFRLFILLHNLSDIYLLGCS